jgi:hypothetical protein
MVIECRGEAIAIWVNGDRADDGFGCTANQGQIAIQIEGAPCECRRLDVRPRVP